MSLHGAHHVITAASVITLEVLDGEAKHSCVFEPKVKLRDRPASAVDDVSTGKVPVQLMSPSGSVKLHKGTVLGYATPTAECSTFHPVNRRTVGTITTSGVDSKAYSQSCTQFLENLSWPDKTLDSHQLLHLQGLVLAHRTAFSAGSKTVERTTVVHHSIPTAEALRIKQGPQRVPHALRPLIDEQVNTMLKANVIQPSFSPWSSPLFWSRKGVGNTDSV